MSKSLEKVLPELVSEGIISEETSQQIKVYIDRKPDSSGNRLLVVFGILGALLVGLGIILILAHNWDDLSKTTKTIVSFIPMLAGQFAVAYTLSKKKEDTAWKEASAVFLFLAAGSTISLIAQVYNISGDLNKFIITWTLLGLPLVYLLSSSMTALLYIIGVTFYGCNAEFFEYGYHVEKYWHWLMLAAVVPYYVQQYRTQRDSNFFTFLNWFLALSLVILLGTFAHNADQYMYVAYFCLFSIFCIIGSNTPFVERNRVNNPWIMLGRQGIITLLMVMSFKEFWYHIMDDASKTLAIGNPEILISLALALVASWLLYSRRNRMEVNYFNYVYLVFIALFFLSFGAPFISVFLDNALVFLIALYHIRKGARMNHLGILNYGLLVLAILITCRYFDSNMSFLLRGMLFVGVGIGFFAANYTLLKRRRQVVTVNSEQK
jgi:uncharacterized membrane protein